MAVSSALAGAAGALLAPLFFVNPFLGMHAVLKALVVVVIGGLGSIPGAIAGGLLLGFVESVGNTFLGGATEMLGFRYRYAGFAYKTTGTLRPWLTKK